MQTGSICTALPLAKTPGSRREEQDDGTTQVRPDHVWCDRLQNDTGEIPAAFPRIMGPNCLKYLQEVIESGLTAGSARKPLFMDESAHD